jgi:hypothetical protein
MEAFAEAPDTLRRAVQSKFKRGEAYKAYLFWRATRQLPALYDATRKLLPYVGVVARKRGVLLTEDRLSAAVRKLYRSIAVSPWHINHEAHLYTLLASIITHALEEEIKTEIVVRDFAEACADQPVGSVQSIKDVEFKIFLEQLPKAILAYYTQHNRLTGKHYKAGQKVLIWVMRGEDVPQLIRSYYDLSKEDFDFVRDYVIVMIRRCLCSIKWEFRDVIDGWLDMYDLYNVKETAEYEEYTEQ